MSIHYKKLFEPIKIGSVEIKNRIFMSPMGPVGFAEGNGAFTKAGQEYYIERARGGTGLIMTGTVNVDYNEILPGGLPCPTVNPVAFTQSALDMLNSVHSLGAKFFLQLSGGLGRSAFPGATSQHIAPSPALNRFDPRIQHREMTHEEIQTLIANFVKAAVIAKGAGFDGIEIHAVHEGYLLDQFGLSFFNQRTDEYGGSLENRLRIATQIVQGIKQVCGKDFPVGLRFSPKSFLKGYAQGAVPGEEFEEKGRDYEEGIEAAKLLVAAGYDELNVDAGTYDSWYWNHPPMYFGYKGIYREFGRIVKQNVDVPVLISGRMDDPQMACDSIDECCDMVGFGRPLLADPYLPQKIADGQLDEIRPCLSCHEACMGRCSKFVHLSCAVNPQCGFEIDKPVIPTCTPKTVLVAGGGVAEQESCMNEFDGWAGKRLINLDFNDAEQLARVKELIHEADVVTYTYRDGILDKFGLSEAGIRALNPNVVYSNLNCFSDTVWRNRPGWAPCAEDISGISIRNGSEEHPQNLSGVPMDYFPGFLLAIGTLLALRNRLTIGGGWKVTTSLTRGAMYLHECADLCASAGHEGSATVSERVDAPVWDSILQFTEGCAIPDTNGLPSPGAINTAWPFRPENLVFTEGDNWSQV